MKPKARKKCCRPKIKTKRKAVFDIGFSELLLIAVAGIVVIGPKDLPVVVRHVAKFMRELRSLYAGLKGQMNAMMDEAGINDMRREMTTIIDLEGKPQVAYDVAELEKLSAKPSVQAPKADA